MSGIKRTIDRLNERAQAGDREATETLRRAGLWRDDDEAQFRADALLAPDLDAATRGGLSFAALDDDCTDEPKIVTELDGLF
jgi:hypothetical protein